MGRMAGVFDNPPGFPFTPPGVDVLEGGKLTSNNVAGSSHDPLQSFAVASGGVSKPGGDAAGQDALHSAGVEGSEDAGARSKLPQPSQEEEVLICLLQHTAWYSIRAHGFTDVHPFEGSGYICDRKREWTHLFCSSRGSARCLGGVISLETSIKSVELVR